MRTFASFALLALTAGVGCVGLPKLGEESKKPTPPATVPQTPVRPAVTADQVSDRNAREMAGALVQEMDREAPGNTPAADQPAASAKQPCKH
jgi:hypothetical protein